MANLDPEISAMSEVYKILDSLENKDARLRVLNWVCQKLELSTSTLPAEGGSKASGNNPNASSKAPVSENDLTQYDSIADVFSVATSKIDTEKVLLTAAYLQEKFSKTDLSGREINQELHNLGYRVTNITSSIGSLSRKKPQLMIQTKKSGKSQQAKKKYKVTTAGIQAALEILSRQHKG